MTASCACTKGVSVAEFCEENPRQLDAKLLRLRGYAESESYRIADTTKDLQLQTPRLCPPAKTLHAAKNQRFVTAKMRKMRRASLARMESPAMKLA